ncbi:hypothetical protein [Paeniglutamicibacter gangotriensis]
MARRHTEVFLTAIEDGRFAKPNPRPMFPNPPGLLRIEPHSEGLRERIWWGAGSDATAHWAAQMGMNLMASTLKFDEIGKPLHVQRRKQIEAFHEERAQHDHGVEPRVSISRSIFAITNDQDCRYFLGAVSARIISATSTRRPARCSVARTRTSPMRWWRSYVVTRRSRRPIRCC